MIFLKFKVYEILIKNSLAGKMVNMEVASEDKSLTIKK